MISHKTSLLFVLCISVFTFATTLIAQEPGLDAHYDYYSADQFHETWIDLNGNGSMEPYENPENSPRERAEDVVSRLMLEEKTAQMQTSAPEISRLGVPAYTWWLEALHGVTGGGWNMPGKGTVYPQNIGLAATFNTGLLSDIYTAVSSEARAKFHHEGSQGLNYYSPAVLGVMRDTRWQRTEESFGEDPYLVSRLGVAAYRAFQGEDEGMPYRKAVATAKHFVSNRGPYGRDHPYANLQGPTTTRLMREISFPPYQAAIQEGNVGEVMAAYSRRPTGLSPAMVPPSYSEPLLTGVLRGEWGFQGHITSDCGALTGSMGLFNAPLITEDEPGAAAASVLAGIDLNCGSLYGSGALIQAVKLGMVEESKIDSALVRLFASRFNLGVFDPPNMVPYAAISADTIGAQSHIDVALQAARESLVLLKNDKNLLPLDDSVESLAVIGPSANEVHFGGYSGQPPYAVTLLEGIQEMVSGATRIDVVQATGPSGMKNATEAAQKSEVAIVVLGPPEEGEGSSRPDLAVPPEHLDLLKAAHNTGTPVVAVLINGSPMAGEWVKANIPAILEAWYPGMEGGTAIAEAVFGAYNPGGKLPVTFPRPGEEPLYYNHKGELTYDESTYLWPFGHGLSYSEFTYRNMRIEPEKSRHGEVTVTAEVENTGDRAGDEVIQLYLRDLEGSVETPVKELKGFHRVSLDPGERRRVEFEITPEMMSLLDPELNRLREAGEFQVMIGASSQDIRLEGTFSVTEDSLLKRGPELKYSNPSLSRDTVQANQPLFVQATLGNDGDITGWDEQPVFVDGEKFASKKLGIGPGKEQTVEVRLQLFDPGTHQVKFANLAPQTVTVLSREPAYQFNSVSIPSNVKVGDRFDITARLMNLGSTVGSARANLYVDDLLIASQEVTVEPGHGGGVDSVTFRHRFHEAGTHRVGVGNLSSRPVVVWEQLSDLAGYHPPEPSVEFREGRFGNGIVLERNEFIQLIDKIGEVTDGYESSFFPENGAFTISFWFNPSLEKWGPATLFDATRNPFYFYISATDSTVGLHFEPADDSDMDVTTGYDFGVDTWYHITAIGRFSDMGPHLVYINGEQVASRTMQLNNHGRTGQPRLGASRDNYGSPNNGFTGSVDELRIYRRALSSGEIRRLYQENTAITDGQVLRISFDE